MKIIKTQGQPEEIILVVFLRVISIIHPTNVQTAMDTASDKFGSSCFGSFLDMYQSEMDVLECKTCRTLRFKNKIIQERFDEANSAANRYK